MTKKRNAKGAKKAVRIRGKGDYLEDDRQVLQNVLSKVNAIDSRIPNTAGLAKRAGGMLGGLIGQGHLGEMAGGALGKLFGLGDYTLKTNSLMSVGKVDGNTVPVFSKDGKRGIRVVEREYLGDVFSGALSGAATVFNNAVYPLNPSNASTFPWLSKIAVQFDQWEPNGIVFEFVSTSSEFNGTSQALGAVIAATDYNSTDAPYVSKQEMENADYANSTKAAMSLAHGIECDPNERITKLLYTGPTPTNDNINLYNLGNFQIATQGMSVAGVNLGELWVSYDISFFKKQLNSTLQGFQTYQYSTTLTTQLPLGVPVSVYGQFQLIPVVGFNGRYAFPLNAPLGRYSCIWYMLGASGPSSTVAGISGVSILDSSITSPPLGVATSSATARIQTFTIDLIAPGGIFVATGTITTPSQVVFQCSLISATMPQLL